VRLPFSFVLLVFLVLVRSTYASDLALRLTPADFHDAEQPQLCVTAEGTAIVVFGRGEDIFVCRSTDAKTVTSPIKVGSIPKLALGKRRGPRIAASGSDLTVTAMADDLFAFHSSDAGNTWSEARKINSVPKSASEGLHALAGGQDGQRYLVWLDQRSGAMEVYGAGSNDGGKTWSRDERIYQSPDGHVCECCHPSAIFNERGDLAVMWRNWVAGSRDLWKAVRPAGAKTFSAAEKEGSGTWKLNGCPMDGGSLIVSGSTKFASTWRRGDSVYVAERSGEEVKIGEGTQPVAFKDGNVLHVLWQQGSNLMHTTLGAAKAEVFAADAQFASLAATKDRGVLVAFERKNPQGSSIYLQTVR
jgi:hypothetical protein